MLTVQKLYKRAYFDDFKIHCLNLITLLLDATSRIYATHESMGQTSEEFKEVCYTEDYLNFRRFAMDEGRVY